MDKKTEELMYVIIDELLPNNVKGNHALIDRYVLAVFSKICAIKNIQPEDQNKVELEAMLLASHIHTTLIDFVDYIKEGAKK